jgi:hypothetical protein
MKTRIITLITLVTVLSATSLTYAAATTNDDQVTVIATESNINKIEASGNVEVYITNGDKDQVKVYDDYYAQNALVQDKDGVLRISSYAAGKLVVLVTVVNLRSITATDNASIRSYGTFSAIGLDVKLDKNASARLKLDVFAANVTITEGAKADLSGSVNDYDLNYSRSAKINSTGLVAVNSTKNNITKKAPSLANDELDNVASL